MRPDDSALDDSTTRPLDDSATRRLDDSTTRRLDDSIVLLSRAHAMSWWIWIVIGFVLLALEFTAASLHLGFFAVGAFVVGLLVLFGVDLPLWAELLIFTAASLIAFFFVRPWLVRKLELDQKKVVDTLVGEQAIAMEEIPALGLGKAEMRGTTWSARNVGETVLNRGQRCVVAAVEGLVIHVRAS